MSSDEVPEDPPPTAFKVQDLSSLTPDSDESLLVSGLHRTHLQTDFPQNADVPADVTRSLLQHGSKLQDPDGEDVHVSVFMMTEALKQSPLIGSVACCASQAKCLRFS